MSENENGDATDPKTDGDLNDMLQELRIVLQGTQVMTAFLIILPFNEGFNKIDRYEQWVYLATFICSVTSLILFTAPAAHHRIVRPLKDREKFKRFATRMIIVGQIFVSLAWIPRYTVRFRTGARACRIACCGRAGDGSDSVVWWILPIMRRHQD